MIYHESVLLKESIDMLVYKNDGIYIDCTYGGGGHTKAILSKLDLNGKIFCFDQDIDSRVNILDDKRVLLINNNFRYILNNMIDLGVYEVDGIIADLGVSSHQIDTAERGFSIRYNSNIDMRMNINSFLTGEYVINNYSVDQLNFIFKNYGNLKNTRRLANLIVSYRNNKYIKTTEDLNKIFDFIGENNKNKFLAKLFQSIRIEVNDELNCLKEMLLSSIKLIKPGGRLIVISYHSVEDRIVKRFMKFGNFDNFKNEDIYGNIIKPFKVINNKVIRPKESEIKNNNRARSAKLRAAVKQ